MSVNLNLINKGIERLSQAANCFEDGGLLSASEAVENMIVAIQDYVDEAMEMADDILNEIKKGVDDVQK